MNHNPRFTDFDFDPALQEGLDAMRFETPTPIQQQAIPLILAHKDLIAVAQTGTGKTAAFMLPVLHKLSVEHCQYTNTLIIVPTRELAIQIDQAVQGFAYFTHASSLAIYGGGDGMSFETEKKALTQGANIIIATPGRLMSHLNMGYVKFDRIQHFILDEADKMLDMGFLEDIQRIATYLPKQRQTLMFSATMPPGIRKLASQLLHKPEQINIAIAKPAEGISQRVYLVYEPQKNPLIVYLLKQGNYPSVLVFSSTKQKVKQLTRDLQKAGIAADCIHSDLEQDAREEVLRKFRNKQTPVLVATDILSRGIDIEDINLVVNYDLPGDAEDYIHRIGRTARASNLGEAITLLGEAEQFKFQRIETLMEREVEKLMPPEPLGAGPAWNPGAKRRTEFKGKRKSGFKQSTGKSKQVKTGVTPNHKGRS